MLCGKCKAGMYCDKCKTKIPEEFTRYQVAAYLTSSGLACPVCGKHEVRSAGNYQGPWSAEVKRATKCLHCKSEWLDIYTLTMLRQPHNPIDEPYYYFEGRKGE